MPGEPYQATTICPSLTGDDEQNGLVWWVSSFSAYSISCFHSGWPLPRSKQCRPRRLLLAGAWVMRTLSPTTMGLELPWPSSGAFHLMFSVFDQFSGALFSFDSPVPRGPRHWSQSEADDC